MLEVSLRRAKKAMLTPVPANQNATKTKKKKQQQLSGHTYIHFCCCEKHR